MTPPYNGIAPHSANYYLHPTTNRHKFQQKRPWGYHGLFSCLQIQLQIIFPDPALLPEDLAEDPAQNRRQDEADEHQAQPIKAGDGCLGSVCHVIDPAGPDTDLAAEAAGAHARIDGGAVHLELENTGGNGARNGGCQNGRDPNLGILHDVGHLQHTGADALQKQ